MKNNSVSLGYGHSSVHVDLPRDIHWTVLEPEKIVSEETEETQLRQALSYPLDSPPLVDVLRNAKRPVILISGKTRTTRSQSFLPLLLECADQAQVDLSTITIILATGTHEEHSEKEMISLIGEEVYRKVNVISHDARADDQLQKVGTSKWGNDIYINRHYVESDCRIVTGKITHHYFAGFTGGRKGVLPGIAGYETIRQNHGKVMEDIVLHPRYEDRLCAPGVLEGNPIHLEMMEATEMIEPHFILNTILNHDGTLGSVVAGDWKTAHQEGIQMVQKMFEHRVPQSFDIVLASCGGHPYDLSFIQMLKSIFNNRVLIRSGGVMILVGACPEGIRKGFHDWMVKGKTLVEIANDIFATYDLPGHNRYLLNELQRDISLIMFSQIPQREVEALGFLSASTVEEAFVMARKKVSDATLGCVIPYGNITVGKVD